MQIKFSVVLKCTNQIYSFEIKVKTITRCIFCKAVFQGIKKIYKSYQNQNKQIFIAVHTFSL
jgi:ribosomal protein L34E